jgi:hypothetical protein
MKLANSFHLKRLKVEMKHRNITTEDWSKMAIDSLFDRGALPDWKRFVASLEKDKLIANETLLVCSYHQNTDSVKLALTFLEKFYPEMISTADVSKVK